MLTLEELERVIGVAGARFVGWRIQEVAQPDEARVVLTLYGREADGASRRRHLLLCCSAESGRVSELERPPRRPASPPAFAQWLKAHAVGGRVTAVRQLARDRIAAFEVEGREELGSLVLQLFGRRSNLYALAPDGRLVASLRPLRATRPELAQGEPWRPPEASAPRRGEDRFAQLGDDALLVGIEAEYAVAEAERGELALTRRIEQALAKEQRKLDRKLEKLEQELVAGGRAEELARHGELLKGALGRIPARAEEVVVSDPATGEDVTIPLDPAKSPSENLDAIFRRYKKALRRLTKGGAQEAAVREAAADLERLREGFDAAREAGALEAYAEEADVVPLLARHAPPAPATPGRGGARRDGPVQLGKRSVPRRLVPRRYPTAGGLEIWVGRSDEANDFLSTRLARGKDLFFHLDGAPGSHVVLRTEGRDDPPSEALLDACELAVHFSKARNATRADVHVVPIRNVKKPKGAKPGLVQVHGGRTVHLRRIPTRLQRLLDARIED